MSTENFATTEVSGNVSMPEPTVSTSPTSSPEHANSTQSEKVFRQSEVGSLVNRARLEEREKITREQEAQKLSQQQTQQPAIDPNRPLTQEALDKRAADITRQTMQQERQMEEATRIANEFNGKMERAMEADPEFREKFADLNLQGMLPAIQWANSMDNTADIMKEFVNNPEKLASVMALANTGQGQLAYRKLQSLSASIKANEAAKAAPQAKPPLSQLNSSNVSGGNGEDLDVSSLMKQSWLKG